MAIKVTRKDTREANENIIRRFSRRVVQSGILFEAKEGMRFSKPIGRRERRLQALRRKAGQEEKARQIKLGLRVR